MANNIVHSSHDWLRSTHTSVLAWWIPQAVILAGLFAPNQCSNCNLDHCTELDGNGVHSQRKGVWTYPLLVHRPARAAGYSVRVSVLALDRLPRALAARDTRGLIKFVADGTTRRLLGAHILAPEGADSLQMAALAIRHGLDRRSRGGDLPLSHHGRGIEARGDRVRERRDKALLLRGLERYEHQ